ncbi:hypothetical protein KD923_23645 [Escherichia fergusonii]|nr:hypothetical protein [Escherichia fergusonii]MCH5363137.1 hypothetical protein [Escherichia fergusonii]
MARRYEIPGAFTAAIKKAPNGIQMVSTQDFVTQQAKVNMHSSQVNICSNCDVHNQHDIN